MHICIAIGRLCSLRIWLQILKIIFFNCHVLFCRWYWNFSTPGFTESTFYRAILRVRRVVIIVSIRRGKTNYDIFHVKVTIIPWYTWNREPKIHSFHNPICPYCHHLPYTYIQEVEARNLFTKSTAALKNSSRMERFI